MTSLIVLAMACALAGPTDPVIAYNHGHWRMALAAAKTVLSRADVDAHAAEAAAMVEALSLMRLGHTTAAEVKLAALTDGDGLDLGPGLVWVRLQLAAANGRCAAAVTLGNQIPDTSVLWAQAWLQVARCRHASGDASGAEAALGRAASGHGPDSVMAQVHLMGADLLAAKGDWSAAAEAYRTMALALPWTAGGRSARRHLDAIGRRGMHIRRITPADLLPVAAHQRDTLHYAAAQATYRQVRVAGRRAHRHDWVDQADLGLVELAIVDRSYAHADVLLRAMLRRRPAPAARAQAHFLRGDILGRQGRTAQALEAFAAARAAGPGAPFARLAALSAARLAFATGDNLNANRSLTWLAAQPAQSFVVTTVRDDGVPLPQTNADVTDAAQWLHAWMLWQSDAPRSAVEQAMAQVNPLGNLADAALYWRAHLAADSGDAAGARVHAATLARRAPTSFYTLLALNYLQPDNYCPLSAQAPALTWVRAAQSLQAGDTAPLTPHAIGQDARAAQWLAAHGLAPEAKRMLRALPTLGLSDADRIVAASVYRRMGNLPRAVNLTRHVVHDGAQVEPTLVALAFPRPYARLVHAAAARSQVPEALIYAIMREESSFDAKAASPRQAYGLMQLILPTARQVAHAAHLPAPTAQSLRTPAVSIRLGALYLAQLLRHTHGNVVATAAAYQAGEGNVRRWQRHRELLTPAAFAEEIPYTSTRQYVRDVLADYGVYRLLEGNRAEDGLQVVQPQAAGGTVLAAASGQCSAISASAWPLVTVR
jgi:soluble lytic murein transglycosylase-like protein